MAVTRLAGFAVIVDCWATALAGGVAAALSNDLALSSLLLAKERRVVTDALLGVLLDPVMVVVLPLGVLYVVVVATHVVLFELIFSSWLFADFNNESTVGCCCCCCLDDELGVVCVARIGVFCGVIGQLLEPVKQGK